MNTLLIVSLLVLTIFYCQGQILGGWSQTTDSSLIGECLRKALFHIKAGEDINALQSEASNIICQTQIVNGINIKLDFDLQNKRWRCSFYKSFVTTLRVQYENCTPLESANPSVNHDAGNEKEEDDEDNSEAKIDQLNQNEPNQETVDNEDKVSDQNIDDRRTENDDEDMANLNSNNEQDREKNQQNLKQNQVNEEDNPAILSEDEKRTEAIEESE